MFDLQKIKEHMAARDHVELLAPDARASMYLALADDVPDLVAEIELLNRERMINLSHYYLCASDKSSCPCANVKIFFLFPRDGYEDEPMFGLCVRCGKISKPGQKEPIAPGDMRMEPPADKIDVLA